MADQQAALRAGEPVRLTNSRTGGGLASRLIAAVRNGAHTMIADMIAGLVASIVLIANIISFGALMFPGELSAGTSIAVWAMLIGSCIGGVWIALATTLPPISTGIDSPTGAVLVLLSLTAASRVVAAGGTPQAAIEIAMLSFTAATIIAGAAFYGLGVCRWASYFRFVPYFVIGGFLAATGWFLIAGGLRMLTGRSLTLSGLTAAWTMAETVKIAGAIATLAVLLGLRRWVKSAFATPAALLVMCLMAALALRGLGLSGPEHGWYLPSIGTLTAWSPLASLRATELAVSKLVELAPEILTMTVVAVISVVGKVSSLEVARQASGSLDREFRAQGVACLAAAPFGGIISGMQIGSSRLLEHLGGPTRRSGVICALVLGAVGLSNFDLPGLTPIPIVAGLVFFLGYTFLADGLWRPYVQRAWLDLTLAAGMMAVCIHYGLLVGVLVGLLCACVLFAISYARCGVVRRHLTRAQFASYVVRSDVASGYLRETGDAIQLYWLSGYIFFGSSESVFERIRTDIEALAHIPEKWTPVFRKGYAPTQEAGRAAFVILDFGLVSGADSSAIASLTKLRNFCTRQGTTLVYASLSKANHAALERGALFGGSGRQAVFADVNLALAWCEDRLLERAELNEDTGVAGFEAWLQAQLGADARVADLALYLERKDTEGSQILYRQGEPADSIDLVAAGDLVVDIATGGEESVRVRRITTHTVVGEMGFFRRSARSATVASDGPATLFTLTRASFERMRRERPGLASAFDDFIMRVLADRIEFANREVAALSR
jgi:SulP family sulfate permease